MLRQVRSSEEEIRGNERVNSRRKGDSGVMKVVARRGGGGGNRQDKLQKERERKRGRK